MQIGLPSLLLILFITLKLTGVIAWSWVWVLSPLWISALAACVFFISVFFFLAFKEAWWR